MVFVTVGFTVVGLPEELVEFWMPPPHDARLDTVASIANIAPSRTLELNTVLFFMG